MTKTRVGIINVTGYAGVELARLLSLHPEVSLISVTGRSNAGKKLAEVFPHLSGIDMTIDSSLKEVDFAFSAMPHKESVQEIIPLYHGEKTKVVDISADFRLKTAESYPLWYDFQHPAPRLLEEAVYGLPELHRERIADAKLVANPGCYPTGAILAIAPAVKAELIAPDIIFDSKSGLSGAGRTLKMNTHFSEANESTVAYALEGHRHLPEITQELDGINRKQSYSVSFVPHLVPMTRGILTTAYATLVPGKLAGGKTGEEELYKYYREFYHNEPYVKIVEAPPQTKHVTGSNYCHIHPTIDRRTGRLIVISCIDNLMKGAAGQAVQNMNLMLGFPETTGLESAAVYP
jgi:N-acetyl-gamma-glutamyl-phosphate reductase